MAVFFGECFDGKVHLFVLMNTLIGFEGNAKFMTQPFAKLLFAPADQVQLQSS